MKWCAPEHLGKSKGCSVLYIQAHIKMNKTISAKLNLFDKANSKLLNIATVLYASVISILALRKIYFYFSPLIWGFNSSPIEDLTPWIAPWRTYEGLEIYVLYSLVFISILLTFVIVKILSYANNCRESRVRYEIYAASVLLTLLLMNFSTDSVATFPRWPHESNASHLLSIVVLTMLMLLLHLQKKFPNLTVVALCISILPIVFVATTEIITFDYSYIFFPAYQWLSGVSIADIYFQYDILIAFLAMCWMKIGMSLDSFQVVIELSYFVLLITMYLVSRRIFHSKALPQLFIIFLVLIKVYFSCYGIVRYAQWSPIRLDLWMVVFLLIAFKGPFHWLIGVACGFLILFSHGFGVVYSIAYVQLILCLMLVSIIDRKEDSSVSAIVKRHFKGSIVSIIFIGLSLIVSKIYLSASHDYAYYYVLLGNGFERISESSSFWSFAIIIPSASLLLFGLRNQISSRYFAISLSLVFFSTGNLIYFFGQSNEMHLYLAGTPLIFLLFILIDLVHLKISTITVNGKLKFVKDNIDAIMGGIFILAVTILCSDNIIHNLSVQYDTVSKLHLHLQDPFSERAPKIRSILADINAATNNSKNIQFYTLESENSFTEGADTEFLLYYHSNLISKSFVNPMLSRVFLEPEVLHMQDLINNGYYLLLTAPLYKEVFQARLTGVNSILPIQEKYVLISNHDRVNSKK